MSAHLPVQCLLDLCLMDEDKGLGLEVEVANRVLVIEFELDSGAFADFEDFGVDP